MTPYVNLIVNVDSDPDPVSTYQEDAAILAKYRRMQQILTKYAGGKAAWTILTGSLYRERFFEAPFVGFWREIVSDGADLVLHPEEDLYGPGPGTGPDSCSYYHTDHMREVIAKCVAKLAGAGLRFSAYRGGYHGFTPSIGALVRQAGIGIELSCAPGIVWPEKAADWADAPLSAYYMSNARQSVAATSGDIAPLFEIPWAWDGKAAGTARRFVVGENYLINEFSNLDAMRSVWDAVVQRAVDIGAPQTVSMVCHTYTMGRPEFEDRLMAMLEYAARHGGRIVSPSEAKAIFDRNPAAPSDHSTVNDVHQAAIAARPPA